MDGQEQNTVPTPRFQCRYSRRGTSELLQKTSNADPLRGVVPEATLTFLTPLVPQVKITRLANITGLDDIGIPVWQAIRPLSKYLTVSQGKGLCDTAAKISAIMESMELYHLENIPPSRLHGSYDSLHLTCNCLDPQQVNEGLITSPDCRLTAFEWLQTVNISTQEIVWIPREMVSMDMTLPAKSTPYFRQITTGIAAGNSITEATIKALLEVIERQTLTAWMTDNAQHASQIHPEIDDTQIQELITRIHNSNKSVKLYLIQNPWNIPVYFCEIIDNCPTRPVGTCIGSGCHWSHRQAILASILEAAQTRLTLISGSRDDNYEAFYHHREKNRPIPDNHYPIKKTTPKDFDETFLAAPLASTLHSLIQTLKQDGVDTILLLDHSKPTLKIPVAQVIIPGFGSPV